MSIKAVIDGKICNVDPGTTILEAASKAGIRIPGLCWADGISSRENHSSSCSVCMVKKLDDGTLVTACDSGIYDPVSISTSAADRDIFNARKQSLEMLLSEHMGDCEGPCVTSCPFGIDIPEILKLAWKGETKMAVEILSQYSGNGSFPCIDCTAPCSKACRRRQIDSPLRIKEIMIGLYNKHGKNPGKQTNLPHPGKKGKFRCVIGRIKNEQEKIIHLNSSLERRYKAGKNSIREAGLCLQCSCSARSDCELRDLADEYQARSGAFKTGVRENIPPPSLHGALVFQHGKCIRCRRCERTALQKNIRPVPGFWFRGHRAKMNFGPEGYSGKDASALASACPTGAITVSDYDF